MSSIVYYIDKCIGCGLCKTANPSLWQMSTKSGKAELIGSIKKKSHYILSLPKDDAILAQKSKEACLTKAIIINL